MQYISLADFPILIYSILFRNLYKIHGEFSEDIRIDLILSYFKTMQFHTKYSNLIKDSGNFPKRNMIQIWLSVYIFGF